MVYCSACGTKNEDDAIYCKGCGYDLHGFTGMPGQARPRSKDWDDDCDRECYGTRRGKSRLWGIIIIVVGIWIIFQFVIREVVDLPMMMDDFGLCWIIAIVVGLAIIAAGLRAVMGPRSG